MSASVQEHRQQSPSKIRCAVITISDSRTLETDTGGAEVIAQLTTAEHEVVERIILPDEPSRLRPVLNRLAQEGAVDVALLTGGTGISRRDQTYETVTSLFVKTIPGYGELFRMLSYAQIGPAAMLSRATAGTMGRLVVLTMPGSPAAVRLAMQQIILPELGHLVREAQR